MNCIYFFPLIFSPKGFLHVIPMLYKKSFSSMQKSPPPLNIVYSRKISISNTATYINWIDIKSCKKKSKVVLKHDTWASEKRQNSFGGWNFAAGKVGKTARKWTDGVGKLTMLCSVVFIFRVRSFADFPEKLARGKAAGRVRPGRRLGRDCCDDAFPSFPGRRVNIPAPKNRFSVTFTNPRFSSDSDLHFFI